MCLIWHVSHALRAPVNGSSFRICRSLSHISESHLKRFTYPRSSSQRVIAYCRAALVRSTMAHAMIESWLEKDARARTHAQHTSTYIHTHTATMLTSQMHALTHGDLVGCHCNSPVCRSAHSTMPYNKLIHKYSSSACVRAHTHTHTHTCTCTNFMLHPLQQQLTPREARDERERQRHATYSTTDKQHTPQRNILCNRDTQHTPQHTERQRHASHTRTENTFSGTSERVSNGNRTNKDRDREWEQDLEFLQELDLIRHRIATTTPSSRAPPAPPHELRHLYGRANQCSRMQMQYQNDDHNDASDTESRLDSLRRQ